LIEPTVALRSLISENKRAIPARYRSITSTAVYTALAPNRFKNFWPA
jgi:hypothetical protein